MIAAKEIVCAECLKSVDSARLLDYQQNALCTDCANRFYTACAACQSLVPKDEAVFKEAQADEKHIYCPTCPTAEATEQPAATIFEATEVAELVNEYLALHAQEKIVKDRLEIVKEQLKQIADAQSNNGAAVTMQGADGAVKCTYKTSLKVVPEAVAAVRDVLDKSVFAELFIEKTTFDVNRDKYEKSLASNSDLPEELRQQLAAAVKRSESATLNVVKK